LKTFVARASFWWWWVVDRTAGGERINDYISSPTYSAGRYRPCRAVSDVNLEGRRINFKNHLSHSEEVFKKGIPSAYLPID
jgi:hypothetical protein